MIELIFYSNNAFLLLGAGEVLCLNKLSNIIKVWQFSESKKERLMKLLAIRTQDTAGSYMNVKRKFCIQIAGGGLIAPQHNFINKHWEIADKMDIIFKYSKS